MNIINYWSYRIKRIKNKPLKEILTFGFKRIKFVAIHLENKIKLRLNINLAMSTKKFMTDLQISGFENNEEHNVYIFRYFKNRTYPKFFFENSVELREKFISNFSLESKNLILLSNSIMNKKFYILGRNKEFIDDISWHTDFVGDLWPIEYFADIDYCCKNKDVKLTWELNRHYHLTVLGLSYIITKDEKYVKESCLQIVNWIDKNPYLFGVNWSEGLEASIRVFSCIFTYFCIINSDYITPQINVKILKNIYLHGKYLKKFLSDKWSVNNNHIIAELSVLLLIGICFPEFKESKNWVKFCIKRLEKELKSQILNDGVSWEHSTGYHKFVTEMLVYPIILARMNRVEIPKNVINTFQNMLDFLNNISMEDGKIPLIGDDDQGFMLKINNLEYNDITGISTIGNELFSRKEWLQNKSELAFWLLNGFIPSNKSKTDSYPSFKILKDSGFCIFKSFNDYLLFITSSQNQKFLHAAHRHIDMLSFIYEYKGELFIVDNGTYVYNGDDKNRNIFRSIWMHNTITIDMKNPCKLTAFEMYPRPQAKIIKYGTHENLSYVWAIHDGYKPMIHNRIVAQFKDGYLLYDWINNDGKNHIFENYIHIHPDVQIEIISEKVAKLNKKDKSIYVMFDNAFCISESQFSPRYGVLIKSNALKILKKQKEYNGFIIITSDLTIDVKEILDIIKDIIK